MTLYEKLGGDPALAAAVDELYRRLLSDPVISRWFEGVDLTKLKEHQRAFLAVGLGGPERYDGRSMRVAHSRLAITDEAFTGYLQHLSDSLAELGIDPGLLRQVVRQMESMRAVIVEVR